MPKAYWIAHATVSDMDAYQPYRTAVGPVLAAHGAKFIVRGGTQTNVEGKTRPRSVVIEFPSLKAAQDCYHSKEYQAAKALRADVAEADICIVEGWEG